MIEWNSSLETGLAEIDKDHKELIDCLNEYTAAIRDTPDPARIKKVFERLMDYTEYHFAREERLMEACNYGGYGWHKAVHDKITNQLYIFQTVLENDHSEDATNEILGFLNSWLIKHIMAEDMDYKRVIENNYDDAKAAMNG